MVCVFFKQKTAYEVRISDWSSDVCSSDLVAQCLSGQRFQEVFKTSVRATAEPSAFGAYLRSAVLHSLARSEEHTSELQSLMRISYAVFCLKKKKNNNNTTLHSHYTINSITTLYPKHTFTYFIIYPD